MTPKRKHKPPSDSNYDIVDLCSDDSTDDEDAPRKKIPQWAQGNATQWLHLFKTSRVFMSFCIQ